MRVYLAIVIILIPCIGSAFCLPPNAPPLTSEETARDYREEFKTEFEVYFRDAQDYVRCLDEERARTIQELTETADRYGRFLDDLWAENE